MTTIGPVEYAIFGFPGNQFNGELAPALAALVEKKLVRVLDLVFVMKDEEGNVAAIEFDQLDELAGFGDIEGEVGGMVNEEDIEHAGQALEPNSSAALLVWEDLWAAEFAAALRDCGGVILEGGRIPHELVQAVFDELAAAS
jgi:uncharacterized membrane protein